MQISIEELVIAAQADATHRDEQGENISLRIRNRSALQSLGSPEYLHASSGCWGNSADQIDSGMRFTDIDHVTVESNSNPLS